MGLKTLRRNRPADYMIPNAIALAFVYTYPRTVPKRINNRNLTDSGCLIWF